VKRLFGAALFAAMLLGDVLASALPVGGVPSPLPNPIATPPGAVAACGPVQPGYGEVLGNLPNPKPSDPAYKSSYLILVPSGPAADTYIAKIQALTSIKNAPGYVQGGSLNVFQAQAEVATAYIGASYNLNYAHVDETTGYFDCKGITSIFSSFDAIGTAYETLPQNPNNLGQPCSATNLCSTVAKYYVVRNVILLGTVALPQKTLLPSGAFTYLGSSPAGYSAKS